MRCFLKCGTAVNDFEIQIWLVAYEPSYNHSKYLAIPIAMRLLRFFRLFHSTMATGQLQLITRAAIHSIPKLCMLLVTLMLPIFIYGCIGVKIFGNEDPRDWGTLMSAMRTNFFVLTEGQTFYLSKLEVAGNCEHYANQDHHCNGKTLEHPMLAHVYVMSYLMIVKWVMVTISIAIMCNAISDALAEIYQSKALGPGCGDEGDILSARDSIRETKSSEDEVEYAHFGEVATKKSTMFDGFQDVPFYLQEDPMEQLAGLAIKSKREEDDLMKELCDLLRGINKKVDDSNMILGKCKHGVHHWT